MASIYNADDPAAYERSMGRWSRLLAVPFLDFAALAADTASVLDVGLRHREPRLRGGRTAAGGYGHRPGPLGGVRQPRALSRSGTPTAVRAGGMRRRSPTRLPRSRPRCRCWC
jgi:hypothetical protein